MLRTETVLHDAVVKDHDLGRIGAGEPSVQGTRSRE